MSLPDFTGEPENEEGNKEVGVGGPRADGDLTVRSLKESANFPVVLS